MIYSFFITTTQKTAIRELPPPFLKPIQGKNFPPRCLPSKKGNFGWDFIHPNALLREDEIAGSNQQIISFLNPKNSISSTLPKNRILLWRYLVVPQHRKQISYQIQLPIIKASIKSEIPTSLTKIRIPHFIYRCIPMDRQSE